MTIVLSSRGLRAHILLEQNPIKLNHEKLVIPGERGNAARGNDILCSISVDHALADTARRSGNQDTLGDEEHFVVAVAAYSDAATEPGVRLRLVLILTQLAAPLLHQRALTYSPSWAVVPIGSSPVDDEQVLG